MYYDSAIFSVYVKLWRFVGVLEPKGRRVMLWGLVPIFFCVGQMFFIYDRRADIKLQIFEFFMFFYNLLAFLRYCVVLRNHNKFVKFLKEIADWYQQAEVVKSNRTPNRTFHVAISMSSSKFSQLRYKDETTMRHINGATKRAVFLTKCISISAIVGCIFNTISPLLWSDRKLLPGMHFPGCDLSQSPLHELIYIFQVTLVQFFALCWSITYTNLLLSWLIFGGSVLRDLNHKLASVSTVNEARLFVELRKCIRYHNKIIRFRNSLEELVSMISLFEIVVFCVLWISITYTLLNSDFRFITPILIFFGNIMLVEYLVFWYASEFSTESIKIADAAYNIAWYNCPITIRKYIVIIIAQSQKPLVITAGGWLPLNMETFHWIIKTSYSTLTVPRSIVQQ